MQKFTTDVWSADSSSHTEHTAMDTTSPWEKSTAPAMPSTQEAWADFTSVPTQSGEDENWADFAAFSDIQS